MFGSGYIFSKKFFTGWVVVGIIWIFCSFIAVVIYPAIESRQTLFRVLRLLFTGKRPKGMVLEPVAVETPSGSATPVRKEGSGSDEEKS